MFLTLLAVFVIVILFYQYWKLLSSDYWKKRNIKYVKKTSPFGIVWKFIFKNSSVVLKEIYDSHENEPVVGMFFGSQPSLLLRDPDNVHAVLSSDFHSFYKRNVPVNKKEILTDHILFIDDYNRWKLLRQKVSPLFTSAKLKSMFYIIEKCAKDLPLYVDENKDLLKEPYDLASVYTAAALGSAVFGIDTRVKNTMISPFTVMARTATEQSFKTVMNFVLKDLNGFIKDRINPRPFSDHEEFFIGTFKKVMQTRRSEGVKRNDFIDLCLELQEKGTMKDLTTNYELEPTDEILAAQAFFFFLAGLDTSAVTIHFTLAELASNPDILEKLHKEIDTVFDECEEKLTFNTMEKFKYLEMVLNESMRKYPVIGLIRRSCTKDTVLPAGNITVEKGVSVFIPVLALHRDEKYFPNPDLFDPERFAPENVEKIPKNIYLPFGDGRRNCIGMRYARLQLLSGLAWLLRRYTIEPKQCAPTEFEKSVFSIRATNVKFTLVARQC